MYLAKDMLHIILYAHGMPVVPAFLTRN